MRFFFTHQEFKPHKLDVRYPLSERFEGSDVICLSISSYCIKHGLYKFQKGKLIQKLKSQYSYYQNSMVSGTHISPNTPFIFEKNNIHNNELSRVLATIQEEYKTSHCACLISGGFESILFEKILKDSKIDLKNFKNYSSLTREYQSLLGNMYENSKKYVHLTNSNFAKTLIFSFDRYHIQKLTDTLTQEGFLLAKLECGTYNLIKSYLKTEYYQKGQLNALMVINFESLIILKLEGKNWETLTFRNMNTNNLHILSNTVHFLLDRLSIKGTVGYYSTLEQDIEVPFEELKKSTEFINLSKDIEDPDFYNMMSY